MKYALVNIISTLLDVLFFQKRLSGIPVLMYHAIGDADSKVYIPVKAFKEQMEFLAKQGYHSMLPNALENVAPREKFFLITFDDGFKSVRDVALPILEQYGFKATVFVTTDYIGKTSEYAKSESDKQFGLMDENDLQMLAESGWCVANHFASHKNLTELSMDGVLGEYKKACAVLEAMGLGKDKNIVAYPFNRHSQHVVDVLKKAGAAMGFNGNNQLHSASEHPLVISRIEADGNIVKFKLNFSPSFNRIKQYVR
ncbi:hypothetical protein BK004_01275 [bacterium CG10_46_32]|nr:MAG: hypothetical protein BK004_01275 [bacterium CG10_46_32]PIR56330.1 MAG: hypothetical protein COU73_01290 [Parcubacteria group bacterium CG10_big_fil_rev_8_21_14_0_10_46_32]